ncbi:glycosyltransferase family 2 protein [Dactylosporangium cerinum]
MLLLLPVHDPGLGLLTTVTSLRDAASGTGVVVIDNGSGPASAQVPRDAEDRGCTVLRHDTNRGVRAPQRLTRTAGTTRTGGPGGGPGGWDRGCGQVDLHRGQAGNAGWRSGTSPGRGARSRPITRWGIMS